MKITFCHVLVFLLLREAIAGVARKPPAFSTPVFTDSYLPAGMQVIFHTVEQLKQQQFEESQLSNLSTPSTSSHLPSQEQITVRPYTPAISVNTNKTTEETILVHVITENNTFTQEMPVKNQENLTGSQESSVPETKIPVTDREIIDRETSSTEQGVSHEKTELWVPSSEDSEVHEVPSPDQGIPASDEGILAFDQGTPAGDQETPGVNQETPEINEEEAEVNYATPETNFEIPEQNQEIPEILPEMSEVNPVESISDLKAPGSTLVPEVTSSSSRKEMDGAGSIGDHPYEDQEHSVQDIKNKSADEEGTQGIPKKQSRKRIEASPFEAINSEVDGQDKADNLEEEEDENRFSQLGEKVVQVPRPSLTNYLKRTNVPLKASLQQLASLYDALSKDARKQGFAKYAGYSDDVMKFLESSSEGGVGPQLKRILTKITEKQELTREDAKMKTGVVLRDLDDPGSILNRDLKLVVPLRFMP
ncbi:uncharacterized protein LOC105696084 [Orussus abietinus]|uniref:uncharacterized protein LOC105696084 n=1 Tax=Orussus abietinus TaxID=222816 RepID=UPI0006257689|nr:uncharacterized protein LOC105696084 [Orussus abietinus]